MLYELKALIGSPVIATDGETGSIRTFLFDDQSWKVSYLVVDVGGWLKRRDVVLPIAALEQPDWAKRTCCAHLSRAQMRDSPVVDTEKPVSRQQEIACVNTGARWHVG
jgi:hypothetical protein